MKIKIFLLIVLLICSKLAFSDKSQLVHIAILDNLMSQKLASEKYLEDYIQGIETAKITSRELGFSLKYKTFFYGREPLSKTNKKNKKI